MTQQVNEGQNRHVSQNRLPNHYTQVLKMGEGIIPVLPLRDAIQLDVRVEGCKIDLFLSVDRS